MIEIREQQLRLLFLTHLIRELQRSVDERQAQDRSAREEQLAARAALVNLRLTLAANTGSGLESVTLNHATYVDNLP